MGAKSPVVLILGAGPNIGQAAARTFASKGYRVAVASRSAKEAESTDHQLKISGDFSKADDVVNIFAKVKELLGILSVVIYVGKRSVACVPSLAYLLVRTSTFGQLTPHSLLRDL